MSAETPYKRIDPVQLGRLEEAERRPLHIRWWILPLGLVFCAAQAVLNVIFENRGANTYLIATQISIIAFAFLMLITVVLNPLLRLGARALRGILPFPRPFNRSEVMALFAALFVSAGISSFGLADQLIPLIVTPFNKMWNTPQRRWSADVIPHLNRRLYITDTAAITQFRVGFNTRKGLWGKIPWGLWAEPVGLWLLLVAAFYVMFYSLSGLLYDTWARREKLVFPLARIPERALHAEGDPPGSFSPVFRASAFWIGFLLVFLLLSYNGAWQAGWIRGVNPLHMGIQSSALQEMTAASVFKGITVYNHPDRLLFMISWVAIGIAFLLPLEISLSLWSYKLIGLGLFLIAIWSAAGASLRSFRSDWLWDNHFVSSLGAGGLLAFAAAALVKLFLDRWATAGADASALAKASLPSQGSAGTAAGGESSQEPRDEERFLRRATVLVRRTLPALAFLFRLVRSFGWSGLFFLVSVAAVIGWLWWSGVSPLWGSAFLAVVILVTVGLMRVVAEGGVYWFQIHTGPFHLARLLGGVRWIPAAALAPLMPVYSVLFLDIKTFMAPAVLNSFKMQEETRASRRRFHAVVLASILVTVIASLVTLLYLAYEVGANRSTGWFFTSGPQSLFDQTQRLVGGRLTDVGQSNLLFYGFGAAWVVLSIVMRRRFFWWLHPIGFAMMANPLMTQLWFSFFIGWLCKKLAVKYGGRHMFAKLAPFFFGLVLGEIMASFVWAVLAQAFLLERVSIDINRYNP